MFRQIARHAARRSVLGAAASLGLAAVAASFWSGSLERFDDALVALDDDVAPERFSLAA